MAAEHQEADSRDDQEEKKNKKDPDDKEDKGDKSDKNDKDGDDGPKKPKTPSARSGLTRNFPGRSRFASSGATSPKLLPLSMSALICAATSAMRCFIPGAAPRSSASLMRRR